jgi:hypothetical protein
MEQIRRHFSQSSRDREKKTSMLKSIENDNKNAEK